MNIYLKLSSQRLRALGSLKNARQNSMLWFILLTIFSVATIVKSNINDEHINFGEMLIFFVLCAFIYYYNRSATKHKRKVTEGLLKEYYSLLVSIRADPEDAVKKNYDVLLYDYYELLGISGIPDEETFKRLLYLLTNKEYEGLNQSRSKQRIVEDIIGDMITVQKMLEEIKKLPVPETV